MISSDTQEIAVCKIRVQVHCPALNLRATCRTWGFGDDRLFVEDLPPLAKNTPVEVEFTSPSGPPLTVTCTVGESVGEMAFLRFPAMSPEQWSRVEELIWPNWDGENLLEGVVILSRQFPAGEFPEWLRLTKIATWYRRVAIGQSGRNNDS